MAISLRTSGSWAAANATTQTVTLPTHQTGDMLLVRVAFKHATMPTTVTCNTSGWQKVGQYNNGTTVSGNGTGSVIVAVFWKVATSGSETNPVITYHASVAATPSAAVAMSYQCAASETWITPVGDGGSVGTGTALSATIQSHISTTAGDMVDFFHSQGDNNTLTVPTFTQTGLTLGTVSERPAAALSSATSNDIDADGGYRLVSSGTSSAAAVVTGTSTAGDQGSAWTTRLRVVPLITLGLLDASPALYAPTVIPDQFVTLGLLDAAPALYAPTLAFPSAYADLVASDGAVAHWRVGEPSGTNAVDAIGTLDGTYQASPTLGVGGALADESDTAVTLNGTSQYISVPDNAVIDLGDGPLSYEIWFKRSSGTQHSGAFFSKGSGSPILVIDDVVNGEIQWYARGVGLAVKSSTTFTDTTTWHHIVGTKSNTDVWLLYLDGVDVTTSDGGGTPSTSSNATEMNIGRDNGGTPGSYLQGSIDEAAVYNVVLTPAQVLEHYQVGTGDTSSTVTLGLLDAAPALYAPTLTPKNDIVLALLDASPALYAPTLTPKNDIVLALLDATPALYAPTILPQAVTVTLGLLDATPALYAPSLSSFLLVSLDLLDASPSLYQPSLAWYNLLSLDLLDASPSLYAPTISAGSITITLALLDSVSALYAPVVAGPPVIMVVGDKTSLTTTDAALRDRLIGLGYSVTIDSDEDTARSTAGYEFVLVAESCVGATFGAKYLNSDIPVIILDTGTIPLALELVNSSAAPNTAGQTAVDVSDTAHTAAAGKTGTVTVYGSAVAQRYTESSVFNAAASDYLVESAGDGTNYIGVTWDAGSTVFNSHVLEARRAMLSLFFEAYAANQTSNAWDFFDALIAWAVSSSQPVTLSLLDAAPALYAPTLSNTYLISLALIDGAPALYAPTLVQGGATQTIILDLLDASAALYQPVLAPYNLVVLDLIESTSALYAPTLVALATTITLGLLDATPTLYAPLLTQSDLTQALTLGLLDSGSALYEPVLVAGGRAYIFLPSRRARPPVGRPGSHMVPLIIEGVYLPLLDGERDLFAPVFAVETSIILGLLDAGPAVYAPSVYHGSLIELELLDTSSSLYAPTISTTTLVTLGLLDSGSALYAPSFGEFSVIALGLLDGGPTLYAPTFYHISFVTLSLLDGGPTLYQPVVDRVGLTVFLTLLDSGRTLHAPSVILDPGGVLVSGVIMQEFFPRYRKTRDHYRL